MDAPYADSTATIKLADAVPMVGSKQIVATTTNAACAVTDQGYVMAPPRVITARTKSSINLSPTLQAMRVTPTHGTHMAATDAATARRHVASRHQRTAR